MPGRCVLSFWHAAASSTARPRRRRRSRRRAPPWCSYPRPHLLLPQLHGRIIALDRPPGGLLPGPAVPLQQPPGALYGVGDVEQSADQRPDPGQRPSPIRPTVHQRSALQFPLQPGNLNLGEPGTTRRALGEHPGSRLARARPDATAPPTVRSPAVRPRSVGSSPHARSVLQPAASSAPAWPSLRRSTRPAAVRQTARQHPFKFSSDT